MSSTPKPEAPAAAKPVRQRKPAPGSRTGGPFVDPQPAEERDPEDAARRFHRGLNLLGSGN